MVLGNDVTSPVAINVFEENGATSVFDNTKIAMIMDHFTPNKDIKAATQVKQVRTFADKYDIKNYRDVGQMGIEHALLPEQGLVGPGLSLHRCRLTHLYIRRTRRILNRCRLNRYGGRYDQR